jgi:hypothetical protein
LAGSWSLDRDVKGNFLASFTASVCSTRSFELPVLAFLPAGLGELLFFPPLK